MHINKNIDKIVFIIDKFYKETMIKMNEGAARGKMPSWCAFCDFTNKIKKGEIQE